MATVGEAYFGKVTFVDGNAPLYKRPYLVVEVTLDGAFVINVSSTEGKEHKLLYPNNYPLENHNPPFLLPSFVKLDSKVFVCNKDLQTMKLLSGGRRLNNKDLNFILNNL